MPSSSMKYVENEKDKNILKPSERRRNVNRPALSDRQKRPDMQIYIPRALRCDRAQNKYQPKESKIKSESAKNSVDKNVQQISNEHTLRSENQLEKDVPLTESCSDARYLEKPSHTKVPHSKVNNSCNLVENEAVSNASTSCLLTDEDITYCEKNEIPSSSCTLEISILHKETSNKNKEAFPQMITENTNILPISSGTAPSFQDSETTDGSISSEDICTNSEEVVLKKSATWTDESKAFPTEKSSEAPYLEKEDSWETKFDDDGECKNPEFLKDLKSITGEIEVLVAKNKYKDFLPANGSTNEGYDNIVELFDFPREFNTQDLVSAFSQFQQSSYSIKWVDDCHALAVFSSPHIANQALMLNHPFVKTRPLSEGIKESKEKARWCARHSEPVKPRPTTSAVLARRLVSGALGLKVQASKEQRDQERNILKEAKEKRRLKAKQKQAIWDGIVL